MSTACVDGATSRRGAEPVESGMNAGVVGAMSMPQRRPRTRRSRRRRGRQSRDPHPPAGAGLSWRRRRTRCPHRPAEHRLDRTDGRVLHCDTRPSSMWSALARAFPYSVAWTVLRHGLAFTPMSFDLRAQLQTTLGDAYRLERELAWPLAPAAPPPRQFPKRAAPSSWIREPRPSRTCTRIPWARVTPPDGGRSR